MSDDGVAMVRLSGEIDIARSSSLRQELMGAVDNRDSGLVVDLSEATYLDSAGVNVLFEVGQALRERQLQMALVVPPDSLVERVVTLVDLGSVAPLERDAETAAERIGGT
jgi:anti-anti-sigma factor